MNPHRIIEAAITRIRARSWPRELVYKLEIITFADKYCEPGYSSSADYIAFGNWNGDHNARHWDETLRRYVDDTDKHWGSFIPHVAELLEKAGVELEWEDEWTTCSECGGAVRCQPNSYGWQRAYVETNGEIICCECAPKFMAEILEQEYEGSSTKCVTDALNVNLSKYGYTLAQDKFENGWYGGQDADPKAIAKRLKEQGISRFLFHMDSVGQFDMQFSLWIHESEFEKFQELNHEEYKAKEDPAVLLDRGLRAASKAAGELQGEGITYTKINLGDGTATARKVSPEEFVQGIKD